MLPCKHAKVDSLAPAPETVPFVPPLVPPYTTSANVYLDVDEGLLVYWNTYQGAWVLCRAAFQPRMSIGS